MIASQFTLIVYKTQNYSFRPLWDGIILLAVQLGMGSNLSCAPCNDTLPLKSTVEQGKLYLELRVTCTHNAAICYEGKLIYKRGRGRAACRMQR